MKKDSAKKVIWYFALYAMFFLLSCYMVSRADDLVFKAGIERYGGFSGWVKWFSNNWGGRIVPQGLLVILLQFPPVVFNLFNAFAWVLLVIYIKKVFDADGVFRAGFIYGLIPALIFILIPTGVLTGTVFWKCANVLYLWGSAALLAAVYPLVKFIYGQKITVLDYVFSFAGAVYASSFEQAGVFMCGVLFLLLLYSVFVKRMVKWQIVVLFLLAAACTFYFCRLPGNAVRSHIEVLGQLPKYDMYSTLDKVLWGVWYVINYIEEDAMYIVLLLAGTVVFLMHQNRKRNDPVVIGADIMLVFFVLCTINRIGLTNLGREYFLSNLFKLVPVDTVNFGFSALLAICSVIHFLAYVYLGCCILIIHPEKLEIIGFSFFFGGLASMWMMGFSPTIYASKARPRFLCYLFLLCVGIRIISGAMCTEREKKNVFTNAIFHSGQ